ncbi:PucR family transcriptional regulator [Demequina mangrovi]|uniref:Purine catabolism regulatory protein n=1 Tax=Demequina mangrovi TaxID=1043493 RepID=A0A1H6Y6K7_9MICO|nr:PucR family transcriptional regulator [Demequina mangrovi]SEJ32425.1 purine catabolism regulatory protein [Demequina mangrovi]
MASPTIRALLARPELHLRLTAPEDDVAPGALDATVRWVHSSDLADPTPFLAGGMVLLTTGTQFRDAGDDPKPYAAYVRRLARSGMLGLGFGTEVVRNGVPEALIDACREARLPLWEVPYDTPFIALARANAEALAAVAYERRTWALDAQRAVAVAALRPDGLRSMLAELSRRLGAWVGLLDGDALLHEHPGGGIDAASVEALRQHAAGMLVRGVQSTSGLEVEGHGYHLQTLGQRGRLRAVLAIAQADLDEQHRAVVTTVVAMAALALEQRQDLEQARDALGAGVLAALVRGDVALAADVARASGSPLPAAPVVVAVADQRLAEAGGVGRWLDARGVPLLHATDHGDLVMVLAEEDAAVVDELVLRHGGAAGLSGPVGLEGVADALGQARTARERRLAPVTRFADLSGAGVLALLDSTEARVVAQAALDPLVAHDARHGTDLVATVAAWFDADCAHDAAARTLGVHRHTVRARLTAAQELLGQDLATVAGRAQVWAALRAAGLLTGA